MNHGSKKKARKAEFLKRQIRREYRKKMEDRYAKELEDDPLSLGNEIGRIHYMRGRG